MSNVSDPVKRDGKIREQIERENFARRRYPSKWGEMSNKEHNKFYNQNYVNNQIRESGYTELCPYHYTGHGDSYFVSREMYDSLIAKCRCGRPKSEAHIIKCLQKVKNKYLDKDDEDLLKTATETNKVYPKENHEGFYGWPKNRYLTWEHSTHYVSPKLDMPGYKMDQYPFSNIFIG